MMRRCPAPRTRTWPLPNECPPKPHNPVERLVVERCQGGGDGKTENTLPFVRDNPTTLHSKKTLLFVVARFFIFLLPTCLIDEP